MLKLYIVAKWIFFMSVIAPILFFMPLVAIAEILHSEEIVEGVAFIALPLIYYYLIKKLLQDTYENDNVQNVSSTFMRDLGMIYFSYFIIVATVVAVLQINVLAFFAGLPLLLSIVLFVIGYSSARSELLIKEVVMSKPYQIGNIEVIYAFMTVSAWILALLVG